MSTARPAKNRSKRTFVGLALICLGLGAGNIFFGHFKYNQYQALLSEATAELARPESGISLPLMGPTLNIDKQTQHITRIKSRLDFYSLVILGGECILAAGAMVLAACLLTNRWNEDPKPS